VTDKKTLTEMLSRNRLFDEFSKKDIAEVISFSKEIDHSPGQLIVEEGRSGVGFHLILAGSAAVSVKGRKVRTLGPGDSFGDIAVIDGGPRSASVTAGTELLTLSLAPWEFKPLLIEHPSLAYKLLLKVCALLREAERRPPV
jgi:CRP/FNR family cyclic AMP-dependent transcriptional regulator